MKDPEEKAEKNILGPKKQDKKLSTSESILR